ncbi:MAG: tRNA (5-methylaminomethyl-2-thiouridine)(34)-methyltransferase MnmD [Saprospiraceae bacterium]
MSTLKHFLTADGSSTLISEQFNTSYSSLNGAITESLHVFIKNGLEYVAQECKEIKLFEFGFGTGLNAWLSAEFAEQNNVPIHYDAIELYPVEEKDWKLLNYVEQHKFNSSRHIFSQIHIADWDQIVPITSTFILNKMNTDWNHYTIPSDQYHLIFFDAFAPDIQPELWNLSSLERLFHSLLPGGVLVSYCAKGQFKRDLKAIGFEIENLEGPAGKREVTRAIKP